MPNKRSPIPPHQAATVERLYSDGMSIKKIALAIGRHEKVVSECVKAAGIFRTPLPAAKDKPKPSSYRPIVDTTCPAAMTSEIDLVGFRMVPQWAIPYVEAGRVRMGYQP